jgi:uncharacterized protein YndB with AHSA1/START domain
LRSWAASISPDKHDHAVSGKLATPKADFRSIPTLKGGADTNPAYGSRLDSTVTWTLTPVAGGTHLRMVHDGFVLRGNQFAYYAMSPGWGKVMDSVARVTAGG